MITRSKKFIYDSAVAIFLLALFTGCAQTRPNIKAEDTVEKNEASVIQAITASSDGSQVEVLTDKPLSYTYYKTSDPPKVVIDLSQTEPGSIEKSIEVNSGNIKRIDVSRHEFTGGFLSRVELILDKDEGDYTVTTDQVNKGKLLIVSVPETNPPTAEVQEKSVNVADAPATPFNQNENIAQPPIQETAQTNQNIEKPVDANQPQGPQQKLLQSISSDDEGISINVSGGVDNFNAFKLNKPDRIVVDLPGVKSGVAAKTIPINKCSIVQVRQGLYPDKVRIVLDSAASPLPPYKVVKNEGGLKVVLNAGTETSTLAPQAGPVKETEKTAGVVIPTVLAIDFKVLDELSVIEIKTSGNCIAGKPAKVTGGQSLTIKDCRLPEKLQRMIDTGSFPSVIRMITPYQVKMKTRTDARILAKLRQSTNSSLRHEGDTLIWEFRNPENIKAAAMTKKIAESPYAQKEKVAQPIEIDETGEIQQGATPKYGEKKVYTGRRVSLEFSDADIRKILQLIAEVSNLNFLIGDDVSGTISIKLVNVPWDQALDVILDSKGLEKKQEGNILYIKPKGKFKTEAEEEAEARKARESGMELKTKVFDVNFASISDIAKQFKELRSDRGTISEDKRTNRVIVTDNEERLAQMADLLKSLDIPEKQVMIEARIVEAQTSFSRDLGVQWALSYTDSDAKNLAMRQVDLGLGGVVASAATALATGGAGSSIIFGKLADDVNVALRLSAASTVGLIKVISSPKVLTLNNKTAKISQGQTIPYQTLSAEGTKTEFVEAALTLEVTPHVTADGTVSMKIKATNNRPGAETASAGPQIDKKEAETEVQVKNGETIVIGGIYTDNDNVTDSGVPFLMDIPLLGWLFKSNSNTKSKSELLIFITPRIAS